MAAEMTLDPDKLIAQARAETGLQEFDAPGVEAPLRILTRALREEARLSPGGTHFWSGRLHGILVARLRGRDWVKRHPEILEERVPPPLVILGLSRTGTTLLHRLIAADSRFYSAAWWECRFPVPAPDDMDGAKRIAVAKAEVAAMLAANPDLLSIHPFDAMGADEDILLMDQTLLSTTTETMACVPSYYDWLRTQDLRPAYDYWRRTIQLLQWQKRKRGLSGERWVLKTPMHLGHVDKILENFPDATFAQTHRDPLATIPSYASLIHELWRGVSDSSDPIEAGRQTSGTLEHDLKRCLEVRDTLPAGKFIDIDFRDTVQDPVGVVEHIYRHIGLAMTERARREIGEYMASHPREGRPKHEYTMEQFGFTREEIERRFAEYRRRHIEPSARV
ncbi:MAG TPA: sulfotransferase [Steroidobacteraceae bacterium]